RVAILSTGDELVDLDAPLGPGQIPNSNTYTLAAQVREADGEPVSLGIARDAREDLEERIRSGVAADVLVSSAGVSVGDRDLVRGGATPGSGSRPRAAGSERDRRASRAPGSCARCSSRTGSPSCRPTRGSGPGSLSR